jgi:hypothetical protein
VNLREFVDETLTEILAGIRAAQNKDGGGAVGAQGITMASTLIHSGKGNDKFTVVEFDVSVVAETSGGGKGELKVWSVGSLEGGGKHSNQQTSRVKFAIHLKIPPGEDAAPLTPLKGFG